MKKLSYIFYVVFPPVYTFIVSHILGVFYKYTARTFNHAFFLNIISPAILFTGFGLFVLWKSISKCIKSMSKKESIYLNIAAILIQLTLICTSIGILGISTMMLLDANAIFMIYISFGFDIGMLIHNIRRTE